MSSQPLLQTSPGKRIALPTRIEPKVFFANERTFLSWLNFTAILGGLAIGLLNFGDRVGQISAGLFTLVAMAAMLYALYTFHWRARSIRRSRNQSDQRGGFDDRFGPTVLALALLAAVVVNFVLRVVVEGQGQGQGQQRQGNDETGEMNQWTSSAGIGSGSAGAGAGVRAGAGADRTGEVGTRLDGLAAIEELGFELK